VFDQGKANMAHPSREITVSAPTLTLIALLALGPLFAIMAMVIAAQSNGFHIEHLPAIVISAVPTNMSVVVANEPGVHVLNTLNVTVLNLPDVQQVNVTNFPDVQKVLEQNPSARNAANVQKAQIVGPVSAFGNVMVDQYTPVFQVDAVYSSIALNSQQLRVFTTGTGTVTAPDSQFILNPGTGSATLQSRKRVRYHTGQGVRGMFTARFAVNLTDTYQVAGLGHGEDGVFFGINPSGVYGIMHAERGKRAVRTLTVTTGSSTGENAVITLAGTVYNVPVTNSASTLRTAYEISQGVYMGWQTQVSGSTVIFVRGDAGPVSGTFSAAGTTLVANFAQTQTGVLPTMTWVPQAQWNGADILDGNGASGMTIDPSKLNVYQITYQFLGAGGMFFYVENNFGEFVLVHTLRFPNTRIATTFGNPSFPFTASFQNTLGASLPAGSVVGIGSLASMMEGKRILTGGRSTVENTLSAVVSNTAYFTLFSITNPIWYTGRTAQGILSMVSAGGAANSNNNPVTLYIFRSVVGVQHTLGGTPNFQQYAAGSPLWVDMSATTFTPVSNDQLIWAGELGESGNMRQNFGTPEYDDITLQPGDIISVCARTKTATAASYVGASIDIRADY
jgi:hypothetical protein